MISQLAQYGFDAVMVLSPVTGYVDQYKQIQETKSSSGFSTLVSFILIVANILRVFFWFGKRFETVMLFQSIIMILAQIVMLSICCKYPTQEQRGKKFTDFDISSFWNWEYLTSYLSFLSVFTIVVALCYLSLIQYSSSLIEILGFAALSTEATLGLPQVFRNYKQKSTKGFSLFLLLTWFLGDGFKTVYFIFKGLPVQFVFCGAFQLFVDFVILFQIMTYNSSNGGKRPNL